MASYSNTIRMTGFSGLDIENMVTQLMNAEKLKYDRLYQQNMSLKWTQEAYRTTADRLSAFQTDFLSSTVNSLRFDAAFKKYNISTSSDDVSVVSTNPSAKAGNYNIKVTRLATKDLYESRAFSNLIEGSDIDLKQLILDGKIADGESFSVSYNGTRKTISFTQDDINDITSAPGTLADKEKKFVDIVNGKLNNAFGKNSSGEQRVFAALNGSKLSFDVASANDSLAISNGTMNIEEVFGLKNGINNNILDRKLEDYFDISGMVEGDLLKFMLNGKPYYVINSNERKATFNDVMNSINNNANGIVMSYDEASKKFKFESEHTGKDSAIDFGDSVLKSIFGIGGPTEVAQDAEFWVDGLRVTSAVNENVGWQNADGSVGALVLNLNKVTTKDVVVSAKNNVDDVFNSIKSFIDGLNSLLSYIDGTANQKRPKTNTKEYYTPLTDTQKESMSDKEIENWEAEAKKGLLYNDSILRGLSSEIHRWMYEGVDLGNGKKISITQIGITTGEYFSKDKGKFVIDENKLRKALEENFEDVQALFTKSPAYMSEITDPSDSRLKSQRTREWGLGDRLNDIIKGAIDKNGSIYMKAGIVGRNETDNFMYDELKNLAQRMSDMLDYLAKREEYYYNKFSQMEAAMTQSESQISALMSALGQA